MCITLKVSMRTQIKHIRASYTTQTLHTHTPAPLPHSNIGKQRKWQSGTSETPTVIAHHHDSVKRRHSRQQKRLHHNDPERSACPTCLHCMILRTLFTAAPIPHPQSETVLKAMYYKCRFIPIPIWSFPNSLKREKEKDRSQRFRSQIRLDALVLGARCWTHGSSSISPTMNYVTLGKWPFSKFHFPDLWSGDTCVPGSLRQFHEKMQ